MNLKKYVISPETKTKRNQTVWLFHIDGLVQDCSILMEILQACTNLSMWYIIHVVCGHSAYLSIQSEKTVCKNVLDLKWKILT